MTYYLFLITKTTNFSLIIIFFKENLIYIKTQCSKFYNKIISNNYNLEVVFN